MEILSHVRISDKESQSNAEHSAGVAELASKFAGEFGMEEMLIKELGLWRK